MDSKLQRMAILASMAVILLVSVLVVYTNSDRNVNQGGQAVVNSDVLSNGQQNGVGVNGGTVGQSGNVGTSGNESSAGDSASGGQIGDDLKGFLDDYTFFDKETNPILDAAKDRANQLSMVITSIEKDLRVQIVNVEGEMVAGESFYVKLESVGDSEDVWKYKDLDKDGLIYIGGLSAGEYYVELQPIDGYKVPNNETRVRVKEKVEYLAIDDISLLIMTEEDIDAAAEDTAVHNALEDADRTEIKTFQKLDGKSKAGIDVSKWNGEIDWDKVKEAGVDYAIIRAGYRGSSTGALVEDPYFRANMKGAVASGLQVGVYFFTQAVNEVEAVEEASAVLRMVREYNLDYPIFIDTEGAGGNGRADGLDVETRTLVCEAFCRTVENAGYEAGIYASRNWFNNNLETARLDDYYIWLAEYRSVPLYQGYYNMWQYTSKGKVNGIEGNVDLNIAYE